MFFMKQRILYVFCKLPATHVLLWFATGQHFSKVQHLISVGNV